MSMSKFFVAMSIVTCLFAVSVNAAVITITADVADQTIRADGTGTWSGQRVAAVGYDGNHLEGCHILVFQLPDLGGEGILSADLEMHAWDSAWGETLSLDLYGLRWSSSSTVDITGDFYAGPAAGSSDTLIMGAFAAKEKGNPAPVNERNVSTDEFSDDILAAWLADVYANGAQAGDYVFLRVGPDTDYTDGSNSYIYFDTANTTTVQSGGATYVFNPTLTITTIPEPATLGLLSCGALALIRRKR